MNLLKYITSKNYRENITDIRRIEAAKKEADRLHAATGWKYYVLAWGNEYRAVNMTWVNRMKKIGMLPKNYDAVRLEKFAIYVTKQK